MTKATPNRKQTTKRLSLREARTFNQICSMPRDNYSCGDFSVSTDGAEVWLYEQKLGEKQKQEFSIPKGKFDRLVDSYIRRVLVIRGEQK